MDSKKKYLKNQRWKKKYQPRNSANTKPKQASERNEDKSSDSERESEDEKTLKQPIPEAGWFPEYDSSSSSDLEDILEFSTSKSKSQCTDKNWFDKELDNIKVTPEISAEENKHIPRNDDKAKLSHDEEKNVSCLKYAVKNKITSNDGKVEKKSACVDGNEEDELEFLLSLKEPVHTGPTIGTKVVHNDRKLSTHNANHMNQKPVKSIDLEKWLDSVLDE